MKNDKAALDKIRNLVEKINPWFGFQRTKTKPIISQENYIILSQR